MLTLLSFAVLLAAIVVLEVSAPFTKVEESFNVQGTHDLMVFGAQTAQYDHNEFPGVVPRTFLGSVVLACLSSWTPFASHFFMGSAQRSRVFELHIVRCTLGLLVAISVWFLARCLPIGDPFTHRLAAAYLMLLSALTYHVAFYSSRALPNTFALVIVNCSVALLFKRRTRIGFALLGFAASTFRSDVLVFVAPLALVHILWGRSIGVISGAFVGLVGAALALAVSIPIDSLLWGRLIWPEAVVLLFNTVENKSSEWGTSPFHWYFTSALPKGFLLLTPVVFGAPFLTRFCRKEFVAAILFVVLYSFLPHKEVRFILVVFPTLLCPAACLLASAHRRVISLTRRRLFFILLFCVVASQSAFIVAFHGLANVRNYPGADAVLEVASYHRAQHSELVDVSCGASVYIDAYAGMTGVSRFAKQISSSGCAWVFNKDPLLFNSTADTYEVTRQFDYLVVREEDRIWHAERGVYVVVGEVPTVGSINVRKLSVEMRPFLLILKRRSL